MIVVFLGFYSEENYQLLLELADDRKDLDDKWQDWLRNFIKAKTSLSKEFEVEEVHLDVKKMDDYFRSKKIKNTSKNRAPYIKEQGSADYDKRINN